MLSKCFFKRTSGGLCALLYLLAALCSCGHAHYSDINDFRRLKTDSMKSLLRLVERPEVLSNHGIAAYSLMSALVDCDKEYADSLLDVAADYYIRVNDSLNLGFIYYHKGILAENKGNNLLAAAHYRRCADIYPFDDELLAHCYMCMALTYNDLNNVDASISAFRRAYELYAAMGNDELVSFILVFMPSLYLELDTPQPDSAIYYSEMAIQIMERCNSPFLDSPYSTIGQAYNMLGEYDKAMEYCNRSIQYVNELLPRESINKARIFYHMQQYDSAYVYLSTVHGTPRRRAEKQKLLSLIYEKQHKWREALMEERAYGHYNDSCYNGKISNLLDNVQLLMERNEISEQNWHYREEARIRAYKIIGWGIIIVLLFLTLFYYYKWRIQQHKKRLQQQEMEKLEMRHSLEKQHWQETELREQFFRQLNHLTIGAFMRGEHHSFSEEEWGKILDNANVAFSGFTTKLKESYPLLNNEDIRYCCLVKMGLSQSEIADIVCREKTSVKKRIRRIALEKMNAEEGQLLADLLSQF